MATQTLTGIVSASKSERPPASILAAELSDAKRLFVQFLEDYLGLAGHFINFQSRFGRGCDLILFRAPITGSTLAVECSILLLSRHEALNVVRQKVEANHRHFGVRNRP